jgi:hypothetical protein
MTGYPSKKKAALDEEGMYLVHHTKRKVDDDDDIQVYKRPWVSLTEEEIKECFKITPDLYLNLHIYARIEAKLKEKNT